jgi:tRNA1Val (adenine37-N6)-methyltransferase
MTLFRFRNFSVEQHDSVFKIGTDSMVLGAFVSKSKVNPNTILDIGSGTGVLALILAFRFPNSTVSTIDINQIAVQLAKKNFLFNNINESRGEVHHGSFVNFDFGKTFDLIVCNPPYFSNDLKNLTKSKSIARHDDELPLHQLFQKAAKLISEKGSFWMIYPNDNRKNAIALAESYGLKAVRIINVYGKPNKLVRVIYQFNHDLDTPCFEEDFLIRDSEGSYTKGYIQLTKELHNREL